MTWSIVSAAGSVGVKRWGAAVAPLSLAAVPMLLTGVVSGAAALLLERDEPVTLAARPVLATLYLAIFGSALTFTLYFRLLARRS